MGNALFTFYFFFFSSPQHIAYFRSRREQNSMITGNHWGYPSLAPVTLDATKPMGKFRSVVFVYYEITPDHSTTRHDRAHHDTTGHSTTRPPTTAPQDTTRHTNRNCHVTPRSAKWRYGFLLRKQVSSHFLKLWPPQLSAHYEWSDSGALRL